MAKWDKDLETLISKLGDYVDIQMKILLDVKSGAKTSATKIAFNFAVKGKPLMDETCRKLGFKFKGIWKADFEEIIKLAEENNSPAADKIKKALPVVKQLEKIFKQLPKGFINKVEAAKKQNINYK